MRSERKDPKTGDQSNLDTNPSHKESLCPCGKPNRVGQRTCRDCHNSYMRIWRSQNPHGKYNLKENCRAHSGIICRRLNITKGPCFVCGTSEIIEKHHPDYSKPWEWIWLCRRCHKKIDLGKMDLLRAEVFNAKIARIGQRVDGLEIGRS